MTCCFVNNFFLICFKKNFPLYFQGSQSFHSSSSAEQGNRVFGRFRARHLRESSFSEESLGCRTVDLRTSTIKIDAEDTDLRLCFRIISPTKTYTFQVKCLGGFWGFNGPVTMLLFPTASFSSYFESGVRALCLSLWKLWEMVMNWFWNDWLLCIMLWLLEAVV